MLGMKKDHASVMCRGVKEQSKMSYSQLPS